MKKSKSKKEKSSQTQTEEQTNSHVSELASEKKGTTGGLQPAMKADEASEGVTEKTKDEVVPKEQEIEVEIAEKEEKPKEQEYYDRLVRLSADFDNYKKRVLKEKTEFAKYANERLIKEIIPILDNLERAIESFKVASDQKTILEGIELILKQLKGVLKKEGVESVESKGKQFDPLIHEAISQIPSDEHSPNTIIEEQVKAYFLNNKLIRPATVVVSKVQPEKTSEDTGSYLADDSEEEGEELVELNDEEQNPDE